jgi:hypothetical protein
MQVVLSEQTHYVTVCTVTGKVTTEDEFQVKGLHLVHHWTSVVVMRI